MDERSDAEVIAASIAAPREFGVIFDRHFASIYRYLARRLSAADANDLAGDVFTSAFEQRARFDVERDSALPWLYGMASNLVLKYRRREARALRAMAREGARVEAGAFRPDAPSIVDARLDAERSRADLVVALQALPDPDRELVLLTAFSELSYRELAEATGLSEGTVKSKLSRAKAKLRERLVRSGEVEEGHQTGRVIGGPA